MQLGKRRFKPIVDGSFLCRTTGITKWGQFRDADRPETHFNWVWASRLGVGRPVTMRGRKALPAGPPPLGMLDAGREGN